MKKSYLKISIFVLLMSVCACCFLSLNKTSHEVYAATQTAQNCYYLLKSENTPYKSSEVVGTIEGSGEFVVGTQNLVLTAKANDNYQLVGWQVTYNEQENKTEFVGLDNLVDGFKTIQLTPKLTIGDEKVNVDLTFINRNGYFTSGTFKLSQVFEDLTIVPVFDHIYYQVEIKDLIKVSSHDNVVNVESDTLFYESESVVGGTTTYTDAYFKIGDNYYYYGEVESDGTNFYTIHNTLEETPYEQKVEYTKGAFRFNNETTISFDVNIKSDIKSGVNIDLKNVSLASTAGEISLSNYEDGLLTNYFDKQQDSYLRTGEYSIKFDIVQSEDYINKIKLDYDNLYVVDLILKIDNVVNAEKVAELFGDLSLTANDISGNISIYNFYSRINTNNLQFLVKTATDNNLKAFGLSCVQTISKTINGANYRYYEFGSINGVVETSQYFGDINQNVEISINYLSVNYYVDFELAEYVVDSNLNGKLIEFVGNSCEPIVLKRGQKLELNTESQVVQDIKNTGYRFVGFALSFDDSVKSSISYTVDNTKPLGTKIILCFQKIEYNIVLANYNSVQLSGTYAINSITFAKTGLSVSRETLTSSDLIEKTNNYLLTTKITIGEGLSISHVINKGFDILGYSLTENFEQYVDFTNFSLTADFIDTNNLKDTITFYVHEDIIKYTLTYYIEPTEDTSLEVDVIMANLAVQTINGVIVKYTLQNGEYVEISDANNNTTSTVVKIVVSDLQLNDVVALKSNPNVTGVSSEFYVFNWFTEDDKSTLNYSTTTLDGTTYYNHEETITKSRSIKVVYSMPLTKIMIAIDEEYANLENFKFEFSLEQSGELKQAEVGTNAYVVQVGEVTITLNNIAFGYEFIGYQPEKGEFNKLETLSFNYKTTPGVDTIILKFNRIIYNFYFSQYSDVLTGEVVKFGENSYAQLNVDNTQITFAKPEGYFVESVTFGKTSFKDYSTSLSETNDNRNDSDIINYLFNLSRDQFQNVVQYCGENNSGVVEVYVRINYELFTYQVSVQYGLTQPKGNSRDSRVEYPPLRLTYVYKGVTKILTTFINSENVVLFSEIPYGANSRIDLLSGAPTGLSVSGWRYANGNVISQQDYSHTTNSINLGELLKDVKLGYKFSYIAYTIHVEYEKGQGLPAVEINNLPVNLDVIQVTLYDSIKISAGAIRNNGYKFTSISYKVPIYEKYEYNSETWGTEYSKLYVLSEKKYVLNTSTEYNPLISYYTYTDKTEIITDTPEFVDDDFNIINYVLQDNKITFNIEYELLQLKIINTIDEAGLGVLLGKSGRDTVKNQIDLYDIALFSTTATDKNNITRNIEENTPVIFHDTISIKIKINTEALNKTDGKKYDLTKGLELKSVTLVGKPSSFKNIGIGEYLVEFTISQIMSSFEGETIELKFKLATPKKTVSATTVVKNSEEFYKNIDLTLAPNNYDYGTSGYGSAGESHVEVSLSYMIKLDIISEFKNEYKKYFQISGFRIYCDGLLINETEYEKYGVEVLENGKIAVRLMNNLEVEFAVQPIITFNKGPNFVKTFQCDNNGNAVSQILKIGQGTDCDIQISNLISSSVQLSYKSQTGKLEGSVSNCGKYNVIVTFEEIDGFDWLDEISITETISLTIVPKVLYLTYDTSKVTQKVKTYDGVSDFGDIDKIYAALSFTDGLNININYSEILLSSNNNLVLENGLAYITNNGKDGRIAKANEDGFYDVYFYNFKLKDTDFNRNFKLETNELIISQCVKIEKKMLTLTGVSEYVNSKVYDGTNKANLSTTQHVDIKNKITGDDVKVDVNKLVLEFKDYSVGTNKTVVINVQNVLEGVDAQNYYLNNQVAEGLTIYPYSLSTEVKGIGEIKIINKRGLEEQDKIDLIPINAKFVVEPILVDSVQYANIYGNISKHLKRNNDFAIGYNITLVVDGKNEPVNNNLYLSVPNVKNITGVYFLTGTQSGEVTYAKSEEDILIDLAQIDIDVSNIFITQKKVFLKPWQIVLIVIFSISVVTAGVLTFVIIRKRKIKEYSVHDKI